MTNASNYFTKTTVVVDGKVVAKNTLAPTNVSYVDLLVDLITTPIYAYQSVPLVINGVSTTKYLQTIRSEVVDSQTKFLPKAALDKNNNLWAWGATSSSGQLGNNTTNDSSIPVSVFFSSPAQQVTSSTSGNTALLDYDGLAWSFGLNAYGELGDGTTTNRSSPVSVLGANQFVTISGLNIIGGFAALDMSGKAWTWGSGKNGALGDGTTQHRSSPVSVLTAANFVSIEGGLAIDTNNNCWSWGDNSLGSVGDGTTQNRSAPVQIVGNFNNNVMFIANSGYSRFVLDSDGYCYSWGNNTNGGLGDGTTNHRSAPVSVIGNHKFKKVASSNGVTLALDVEGIIWAWGYNFYGNLGTGSTTAYSSPVAINQGVTRFIDIGVDTNCSAGLDTNGNIWAWGILANSLGAGISVYAPTMIFPTLTFKI